MKFYYTRVLNRTSRDKNYTHKQLNYLHVYRIWCKLYCVRVHDLELDLLPDCVNILDINYIIELKIYAQSYDINLDATTYTYTRV